MAQNFCVDETVAADSTDDVFALTEQMRLYGRCGVFIALNVGTGSESVALRVELSTDGTTWYRTHVYNPAANAYAASVTFTADTQQLAFRLDTYAPYVRLIANNAGATAATLSAFLIPQTAG